MYVAVKSGTRIPARAKRKIFKPHHHHIVSSIGIEIRGDVEMKRGIAIRPFAYLMSIYPYLSLAHGSVKNKCSHFAGPHIETSTIPSYAHVWQTAGATGFQRGMRLSILYDLYSLEIVAHVKRLVDSPVVWHTDTLPPCRTVGFQIDICYIAAMKFPPFSKRNHLPGC